MDAAGFLARYTRRVDGGLSLREEADGRCVLFESGAGCRAYEARPRQCRTWPFWARIVATPAAWAREAADCPGMGAGELVGPEEIERLARSPDQQPCSTVREPRRVCAAIQHARLADILDAAWRC